GHQVPETPITEIVRHVDYVADLIGVDHVAFGSDFDGAVVPDELGGASGFPKLVSALRDAGHGEDAVAKITHGNWLRVLDATWPGAR
ncbi:MAG: membrane dipeptidase, partial [Microvirga sp.]